MGVKKGKDRPDWKGGEFMHGWVFNKIYASAKDRGHECTVTIPYLEDLFIQQNKKCKLSGLDLAFHRSSKLTTASLDRIDSLVGYIEGNVQWLHKDINMMKQKIDNCKFIEYCGLVSKISGNYCADIIKTFKESELTAEQLRQIRIEYSQYQFYQTPMPSG